MYPPQLSAQVLLSLNRGYETGLHMIHVINEKGEFQHYLSLNITLNTKTG